MVHQAPFAVEQFMDQYETGVAYNMGETCCDSLSLRDIVAMHGSDAVSAQLLDTKLVYGHIRGLPELRRAIARLYDDPEVSEANVVVTNGAIGANFLALYALVNPGDHVIAVDPTYQQLSSVPGVFGATVSRFPVQMEDGYVPDMAKLRAMVEAHGTKLLIINNPNNPTGYVWENDVLAGVVALCRTHGVTILSDEVYRPLFHFTPREPVRSIVSFGYPDSVASGSMSKAFALAGIRVGWLVTKNKLFLASFYEKRDYNTISVLMLDDCVAAYALSRADEILRRNHALCQRNLDLIDEFVRTSGGLAQWVRPRGGSTCFVKVTSASSTMQLARLLVEQHRVLVVPGEVFDMPGWLRIGFGNANCAVAEGLKRLRTVLQEHAPGKA